MDWPFVEFDTDWGPTPKGCGWCGAWGIAVKRHEVEHEETCPSVVIEKLRARVRELEETLKGATK